MPDYVGNDLAKWETGIKVNNSLADVEIPNFDGPIAPGYSDPNNITGFVIGDPGSARLWFLNGRMGPAGQIIDLATLDDTIGAVIQGEQGSDTGTSIHLPTFDDPDILTRELAYGADGKAYYVVHHSNPNFVDTTEEIKGVLPFDRFGWSVALGDVNADGKDDFLSTTNNGVANYCYVMFADAGPFSPRGPTSRESHSNEARFDPSDLTGANGFRIVFSETGPINLAVGDLNGDGIADALLGAPDGDAAYCVFGSDAGFSADIEAEDLDGSDGFKIVGAPAGSRLGASVAVIGDVNGDGAADFALGAPGSNAVYVIFGPVANFGTAGLDLSVLTPQVGFKLNGESIGDDFGKSVAGAGDWNGDGIDDIVIGAPNAEDAAGKVYIIFGRASWTSANFSAAVLCDGDNGISITGEALGDHLGNAVGGGGDFNGDGFFDWDTPPRTVTRPTFCLGASPMRQ